MATVQRQLVHKQFNSPIALYSDRNIKETLDRELKVLQPGVVGINFDDPSTTRSGMFAKSAVLAALEEEERNKRGQQTEQRSQGRQSRSRHRVVDRDTVLKINRRHRSCDFEWPPKFDSKSVINTNTQHFNETVTRKNTIAPIKSFFDNYEKNLVTTTIRSKSCDTGTKPRIQKSNSNPPVHKNEGAKIYPGNLNKHRKKSCTSIELQWPPQSDSSPNLSTTITTSKPHNKQFYLPEEKNHCNELNKIRQHFDKSSSKQNNSIPIQYFGEQQQIQSNNINKIQSKNDKRENREILIIKNDSEEKINRVDNYDGALEINDLKIIEEWTLSNEAEARLLNWQQQRRLKQLQKIMSNENKNDNALPKPIENSVCEPEKLITENPAKVPPIPMVRKSKQKGKMSYNFDPIKPPKIPKKIIASPRTSKSSEKSLETTLEKKPPLKPTRPISKLITVDNKTSDNYCDKSKSNSNSNSKPTTIINSTKIKSTSLEQTDNKSNQNPIMEKNENLMNQILSLFGMKEDSCNSNEKCKQNENKQDSIMVEQTKDTRNECFNSKQFNKNTEGVEVEIAPANKLNLDLYFDKELALLSKSRIEINEKNQQLKQFQDLQEKIIREEEILLNERQKLIEEGKLKLMEQQRVIEQSTNSTSCDMSTNSSFNDLSSDGVADQNENKFKNTEIPVTHEKLSEQESPLGFPTFVRKNNRMAFTDGEFIYGPYNFDLFSNKFYQFNELSMPNHTNNNSIIKDKDNSENYDESLVERPDNVGEQLDEIILISGCGQLISNQNDDLNLIQLNDDDNDKNFNQIYHNCNRIYNQQSATNVENCLIQNTNNIKNVLDDLSIDLYITTPTTSKDSVSNNNGINYKMSNNTWECFPKIETTIQDLINFSKQLNYDKNKIVDITKENEYLFEPELDQKQQSELADYKNRHESFTADSHNFINEAYPNEHQHLNKKLDHENYEKENYEKQQSIYSENDTQISQNNSNNLLNKNSKNSVQFLNKMEGHINEHSDEEIKELAQIYRLLSPTPYTQPNLSKSPLNTSRICFQSDDEARLANLNNVQHQPSYSNANVNSEVQSSSANDNDEANKRCDYLQNTSNQNYNELKKSDENFNNSHSKYDVQNTSYINDTICIQHSPSLYSHSNKSSGMTNTVNYSEDLTSSNLKNMEYDINNDNNNLILLSPNIELCEPLSNINSYLNTPAELDSMESGLKRVAWPPPPESSYIAEPVEQEVNQPIQQQQQQQQQQQYQSPTQQPQQPQYYYQASPQEQPAQQVKNVLTSAHPNNLIKTAPVASYNKPAPQSPKSPLRPAPLQTFHSTPSTNFNNISPQPQPQQIQAPLSAGVVSKPLSPLTHLNTSQPPFNSISTSYSPSIASTATFSSKSPLGWAHVDPPVNASYQQNKYYQNQTNSPLPPFELTAISQPTPGTPFGQQQATVYQAQPVQTFRPVVAPVPYQGTPLRKEAPIHQKPAPVFPSQPAAAKLQGGVNMRGDQKWPPAEYKAQSEQENEERKQIAQGPAFRPKRINKDYSRFFAKNALNSTYPGYRAPPGTQHHG